MTDWRDRAACQDAPSDLFFPEQGESYAQARAICAGCPVLAPCLAYALRTRQPEGMWGGTTPRERGRLRRLARQKQLTS